MKHCSKWHHDGDGADKKRFVTVGVRRDELGKGNHKVIVGGVNPDRPLVGVLSIDGKHRALWHPLACLLSPTLARITMLSLLSPCCFHPFKSPTSSTSTVASAALSARSPSVWQTPVLLWSKLWEDVNRVCEETEVLLVILFFRILTLDQSF